MLQFIHMINNRNRGISLVEILVVMAIAAMLLGIGTYWYVSARSHALVNSTTDSIVSALQKAKSNTLTGKGGLTYGVQFGTSTYTTFSGSTYNASDASNISFPIDQRVTMAASTTAVNSAIIFTRLTGVPNATATISIYETANPNVKKTVNLGALGDISVVQ